MSDLGDIGGFLDEQPLSNLDYLDVDIEEYRQYEEALPTQNLDSIPELQEQWKDLSDAEAFALSPENRAPAQPTTPFWSERPSMALTEEEAIALVSAFAQKQIQAGRTASSVVQNLKKSFHPDALRYARAALKQVLSQRGLLGQVYVDSRLFTSCDQGGVSQSLTLENKQAPYVLAKADCVQCVHNQEGRCGMFSKALTFDVQYDENLWDHVKSQWGAEKDLSGLDGIFPIEARIQKAYLRPTRVSAHTALDSKPVITQRQASREEVLAYLDSQRGPEIVGNIRLQRKQLRWAKQMMRNASHSKDTLERLANDPELLPLQKHAHLLGSLYLDVSYFPTYKEASTFVASLANPPAHVVGLPYRESQLKDTYVKSAAFNPSEPSVLRETLKRFMQVTYGTNLRKASKQGVSERLWRHFSAATLDEVWAFTQKVYAKPFTPTARMHEAWKVYDPTAGLTDAKAAKIFLAHQPEKIKVSSTKRARLRQKLIASMHKGAHGKKIKVALDSESSFADLRAQRYLMGHLYVDRRELEASQVRELEKINPKLAHLPHLTEENANTFFVSPEVHRVLACQMADVMQKEAHERVAYTRSVIEALSGMEVDQIKDLARDAFSREIPTASMSADTGASMMEEFEFGVRATQADLEFELNPVAPPNLDFEFKTEFTID
jgi:hypothetical protein